MLNLKNIIYQSIIDPLKEIKLNAMAYHYANIAPKLPTFKENS